jgi:hypothetical protein
MDRMPNQSYLSVWCRDFPEDRILERIAMVLATVPFSTTRPGIEQVTVRAIDASEAPLLEQDFRALPLDPPGAIEMFREHVHSDCSYEILCHWDLAVFDAATAKLKIDPQPLELFFRGEDFDAGYWRDNGHIEVSLGFEHLFTGQAGLLGSEQRASAPPASRDEARLYEAMAWPENIEAYQQKTRENIRKLIDWTQRIEAGAPVERVRLWSEGEEDFEARLEEILAVR